MAEMTIHCPECNQRLTVPVEAEGKMARCAACQHKFPVPKPETMMEETVMAWMDLDLDQTMDDDIPDPPATRGYGRPAHGPAKSASSDASAPAGESTTSQESEANAPAEPPPTEDLDSKDVSVKRVWIPRRKVAPPPEERMADEPDESKSAAPRDRGSYVSPEVAKQKAAESHKNQPLLHIMEVSTGGVRVGFESHWLSESNFRASMPFRCIQSGATTEEGLEGQRALIARPLAWVDKATGHFTDAQELEHRYEVHVRDQLTAREVLQQMRPIEELPPPFNNPMPYFVSDQVASQVTVLCETTASRSGAQCEILIPNSQYALDWLGRVNGVCGEDYAELESQVIRIEAESWREVPERVRSRLAVWFDLQIHERFLAYFNDSDFSSSDAGLAGVALTDQRLVWCRYHQKGQIPLESKGELVFVESGPAVELHHRHAGNARRTVHLRHEDASELADILTQLQTPLQVADA